MIIFSKQSTFRPEDNSNMLYWSNKWGVSVKQINEAIVETGSLSISEIKEVMREKQQLKGVIQKLFLFFKNAENFATTAKIERGNNEVNFKLRKIILD